MRFKQRLKVIQSLEDTAKRSVVGRVSMLPAKFLRTLTHDNQKDNNVLCVCARMCMHVQVRAVMTESAFNIEELEQLYCLFKVTHFLKLALC